MASGDLRILVTTCGSRAEADDLARQLVDAGLAVCAQVGADLQSWYRWQGETRKDGEVALAFKVLGDRFELFVGELKRLHPYDVPQLVAWTADWVDADYLAWARGTPGKDKKDKTEN